MLQSLAAACRDESFAPAPLLETCMNIDPIEHVKRLRAAKLKAGLGSGADRRRVPPGQWITKEWPVLHYGGVPRPNLATWDLRVFGLVQTPLRFTHAELLALPAKEIQSDVHCVTHWTLLDSSWEGIAFSYIAGLARPTPEARFVMAHCEQGYTTSIPLAVLMDDDVLLCTKRNSQDLTPEHGWPLRLLVPKKYFWKSAKWLRGLEFMAEDRLGFWEQAGYHNGADPWAEERFA
jgi:DMSO/TMAO reductase YedYZ molybdopterin-dependent catalytic subunit